MRSNKHKLIAVLGPTATGKSDLGVTLAQRFNGEVISADSRQVYKGLNIGSGKITKREMKGVPHHMLDVASPRVRYAASRYGKEALRAVKSIVKKNKLPIVVGGTGLYIDTLVCGTIFPEVAPNPILRKKLEKKSAAALFALLKKKDPKRAALIDPHNTRRLIRALEIIDALGEVPPRLAVVPSNGTEAGLFDTLFIGLTLPIEKLRPKIRARLEKRLKQGMTREVQQLRKNGLSWKRLDELGLEYRFVSRHLRGLISRKEMLDKLEAEIVHYAKRQITWFKRNKRIKWFFSSQKKEITRELKSFLRES